MPEPIQQAASRRRWFRFSLRTLLAVVTLVAIVLAWVTNERRQSQHELRIAEQLRELQIEQVYFAGPFDSWELTSPYAPPQVWWRDFARRLLGKRIWRVFTPYNNNIKDLTPLAGLKNLQWLELDSASLVTDLRPVAGLKKLERLWLSKTQVTDLTPLAGLKQLKSLDVYGAPVSEKQIEALQKSLPNCKINHSLFANPE